MNSPNPADPLMAFRIALRNGDAVTIRSIHAAESDLFNRIRKKSGPITCEAAKNATEASLQVLIELGADVNQQDANGWTALCWAITRSKMQIARMLLQAGADPRLHCAIFHVADDDVHEPVAFAQLLLDHGADVNQLFEVEDLEPRTVLSEAIEIGNQELVDFLKKHGAALPAEIVKRPPRNVVKSSTAASSSLVDVTAHFEQLYGKPDKKVIREVVPTTTAPLAIHYIPPANNPEGFGVLFTEGLSTTEFKVPDAPGEKRRAELMVALEKNWPAPAKALADPHYAWPIQWMRRIAAEVASGRMTLGKKFTTLRAEDSEMLGANVPFSAWLLTALPSHQVRAQPRSSEAVQIYQMFPLFSEEYAFALQHGPDQLMNLLASREIQEYIEPDRPNVAVQQTDPRKSKRKK